MKKGVIAAVVVALLAGCGFGGWKYYENKKIEEMRQAGVAELQASVKLEDYREAEQQQINEIIETAEAEIMKSENQASVDTLIKGATTEFSDLKTDAQYTKEEEEERKRQEELERQRKEEEERLAAEAAAAAAAKKSKKKSSGGGGCVGGGSDAFY